MSYIAQIHRKDHRLAGFLHHSLLSYIILYFEDNYYSHQAIRRSEKTQIPFLNYFRIKFHVSIYGNPGYVLKNHFYEGLGLRF